MEKKLPIKKAESAKLLAKFIAENWSYCPISDQINIPNCECWGSEGCARCLRRNADHLEK